MSDLSNNQPFDFAQDKQPLSTRPDKERESVSETHLEEVEKAPEFEPEVEKAGVEHIQEEIRLSSQDKETGMMESAEATPVATQSNGGANLPLTDDQIVKALHQKITDSIYCLALWCLRQIQLIHQKLKG